MDDLIRIPSDPERARSPLDMAGIRKEATAILKDADPQRFASLIVEEYYELLLELITALLAIAGLRPRPKLPAAHQFNCISQASSGDGGR